MEPKKYRINQGVNRSIEFKGLKAQYVWYLGGGVVALLFLFAILYIIGVNTYLTLFIILVGGSAMIIWIYQLSNRYGEFGLMKKAAHRLIPNIIKSKRRSSFFIRGYGKNTK